jgi:hypothetical protein
MLVVEHFGVINGGTGEDFPPALAYFYQGSKSFVALATAANSLKALANRLRDCGG